MTSMMRMLELSEDATQPLLCTRVIGAVSLAWEDASAAKVDATGC